MRHPDFRRQRRARLPANRSDVNAKARPFLPWFDICDPALNHGWAQRTSEHGRRPQFRMGLSGQRTCRCAGGHNADKPQQNRKIYMPHSSHGGENENADHGDLHDRGFEGK
ncbi:hypothetical protein GCM10011503_05200 [Henriciella pelagia]|uniref:Uncharacterized protein n=1 Tax=Henriciella pelagia TaxID=1977912 RepID=A0ABQ1J612_9PROT|nr:hypothetical protein GCM10011503_05200 [Henriciella pelagia]